jgi:hypothetical protein
MIIELFGPAAAGKTTLSRALEAALAASGHSVRIVASARPAEEASSDEAHGSGLGMSGFLSRSAKAASVLPLLLSSWRSEEPLLQVLLPPRNMLWSMRYTRYLSNLHSSWTRARASEGICVFDQAYMTALCALMVLSNKTTSEAVASALDALPQPDILVRMEAPRGVLEDRLRRRLAGQGLFERLFELDVEDNLRQADAADGLDGLLRARGRNAIRVSSLDRDGLARAVARVVDEAARGCPPRRMA